MRTRLLDIRSKRGKEIETERKRFWRTGMERIHAGPTPRPMPGKSRCSRLGGNHSTSGLPASPFISTHTGRRGNPVPRQENDESSKQAKFSILAYHLRTTETTVTPTPPLPEPPQGLRPCPLQSPKDTHCLPRVGSVTVLPVFLTATQLLAHSQH